MKKIFSLIALMLMTLFVSAQTYGEYSLPHTTDVSVLKQYVGQRVKVMHSPNEDEISSHDARTFSYKGRLELEYTIYKVKSTKNEITIELIDETGNKLSAFVSTDPSSKFGMYSCNSFFLIDKFKKDKASCIGRIIYDANGNEVATVIDIDMYGSLMTKPHPLYTIRMKSDGRQYLCPPAKVEQVFGNIGTELKNDKVKASYLIMDIVTRPCDSLVFDYCYSTGGHSYTPISKSQIDELGNGFMKYIIKDTITGELSECSSQDPVNSAFSKDLKGYYVSLLKSVERPTDSKDRYGQTEVSIVENNISKFTYKDNIIDLLIFGTSKQFHFILKNISDSTIKVVWNEAAFVDYDGSSSKIMHVGTKYSQREADQPATTIIKGAKIEDVVTPNCNVRYSEYTKNWIIDSMYPSKGLKDPGQLRLMLPIQIKDVVNEYIFIFDVKFVYEHPERLIGVNNDCV